MAADPEHSGGPRILVVGASWVGDMVMSQALFMALRQRHPDCRITVLAPAWSRPLLARMPEVDSAIDLPFAHGELDLGGRIALGRSLRPKRFDRAIVLPNSFKSALIPAVAGIPVRTGWRGEMRFWLLNDIRLLDARRYPRMVERCVALAWPPGRPLPEPLPRPRLRADPQRLAALRARFDLDPAAPVLALCPGAEFGPAKRWPERHYASVAGTLIARGWQVWLLGSARDREVAEAIVEHLPAAQRDRARNLAGATELVDAVDLLAGAELVVSNDSGLMHIAAALDRPLVVVYGSSSPAFTPPLSARAETLAIPVDCGPCFRRECPKRHLKCLQDLPPAMVLDAAERLLTSG
jgi:heptosyltransferase II